MMSSPRLVVFLLHPRFELIDFMGPASVFGATRGADRRARYEIRVVTRLGGAVSSAEGVTVQVDGIPASIGGPIDTLVVPGGFMVDEVARDAAFLFELQKLAARSRRVTSVCSGSVLLAAAGLLDGRRATSHWAAIEMLATRYPEVEVERDVVLAAAGLLEHRRAATHWAYRDVVAGMGVDVVAERYVFDGKFVTGGGVTAGIDMALALTAQQFGDETAQVLQLALEYDPAPPFPGGTLETSAPAIVAIAMERLAAGAGMTVPS